MDRKIYIVLSQTYTGVARTIKFFTHDKYSHVSISFNKKCDKMYSFGRKYMYFPFIGVFSIEDIRKGLFNENKKALVAIYEVDVNKYQYKMIKRAIKDIEINNNGYNIIGLLLAEFKIKLHRNKYYCSEFVYEVLSDNKVKILDKEKVLFRPEEIVQDSFNKIYEGSIRNYITNF